MRELYMQYLSLSPEKDYFVLQEQYLDIAYAGLGLLVLVALIQYS
jgi:hypothetical protein